MKFDDAVDRIRTLSELRRVAGAHVVDHRQLNEQELRDGLKRVKPQYLHEDTVKAELETVLYREPEKDTRVLAYLILIDVILEQYDFSLPVPQTEELLIAVEQSIVDRSNEIEMEDLAAGNKTSTRFRDLSMYDYVLGVAWEHHSSVSPDEANLLRRLRQHLGINEWDHRTLEAKHGKYPKPSNELHTRSEIADVRRMLQARGLLFPTRQDDGVDYDTIPVELATVLRSILKIEIRSEPYRQLLQYKKTRSKSHLVDILNRAQIAFGKYDTVPMLVEQVVRNVPPSRAISSSSPRYGLSTEELSDWCRELNISPTGPIEDKVNRIAQHYDQLRPRIEAEADQRELWYGFYEELARRDYDLLRSQQVIDKDLEIERKFEDATSFLFDSKLNHAPLKQAGSNRPDGLLTLRSDYLMWDNKSKESSSPVDLKTHLAQFHQYMEQADKRVPVFIVIAPAFSEESEVEAIKYHAQYFDRNIVLITAGELKGLAEEWSSTQNKNREEPFPLGLLAASGRFDRKRLGKLF